MLSLVSVLCICILLRHVTKPLKKKKSGCNCHDLRGWPWSYLHCTPAPQVHYAPCSISSLQVALTTFSCALEFSLIPKFPIPCMFLPTRIWVPQGWEYFHSFMHSQCLEPGLTYSRHSISAYWMNEWESQEPKNGLTTLFQTSLFTNTHLLRIFPRNILIFLITGIANTLWPKRSMSLNASHGLGGRKWTWDFGSVSELNGDLGSLCLPTEVIS